MLVRFGKLVMKHEWLVVLVAVVVILRVPSLFEPYWYGDEGIYLTIGQALNRGVKLYSQIHDNKPPLLYWVAAAAGGNLFWAKFILMIWSSMTILVFSRLANKVFLGNKKRVVLSTIFFSLVTTLPFAEGNIVNAELFFLLPLIASVYLLWDKELNSRKILLAGSLIGLATLFKVPAMFEAVIWPLIWIVTQEKQWMKKTLVLAAGVTIPILGSGLYFWLNHSLNEYLVAAWAQNIPYLSTWKTGGEESGIFSVKGRVVVLGILIAILSGVNKKIGRTNLILGIWFTIALFAALLSGRPYPHYFIQAAAVLSLLLGGLVYGVKKEKVIGLVSVVILVITIKLFQFYTYNPVSYYGNFIEWVTGMKTTRQFQGAFDPNVNAIYDIAEVVKVETKANEKIFVWGDLPMLYALTGRLPVGKYTARYHVLAFDEKEKTIELLGRELPKIIVVAGTTNDLPGLPTLLEDNYLIEKEVQNIQVYRRFKKM